MLFLLSTAVLRAQSERAVASRDSIPHDKRVDIENVVITGARSETDLRHLPMTVSVVGRDKIESGRQPSLLPLLTEQVPGLFVTSRGVMGYGVSDGAAGGISLRGLSGGTGRLMVLIDGHPQYMGMMGHPIADAYQSLMAERAEVLRGPASVLYGSNAMGGVVNIVTRRMQEDGVRTDVDMGYGSYNTLQTEVTNRARVNGFTSVVSASYNRTDGHRRNMGFEQYGGYAKLGYEFSKAWSIRADVNVTHFNASQPGQTTSPMEDADQHVTRGMTSFAVENSYERTSGALSVFYNWGRHKINDGYTVNPDDNSNPKEYLFNSRDDMMGVSWYQGVRMFKGNRLTVGVDYYRFGGRAWNRYTAGERAGECSEIADKVQHEVAGYVDFRQHIGNRVTIDAGVRYDHHSHVGGEWIPQAGVSLHLPYSLELKVSVAKGFRYPTIREMYMFPPQNPDLKPERMWNYEIALSQRLLDGRLSWGVNLFYIDGENLIFAVPREGAAAQHEQRQNRQYRCRGADGVQNRRFVVGRCELQFPAYGKSRACRSRTQTLCRCVVRQGTLVGGYGHSVCRGAVYVGRNERSGSGEDGGFRAVERARRVPCCEMARHMGARRQSSGAALRNQRRISDAESDGDGRIEIQLLI